MKNLITIQELSILLQISTSTLYRWVHKKEIPYVKLGGKLRFSKSDIDDFIKQNSFSIS